VRSRLSAGTGWQEEIGVVMAKQRTAEQLKKAAQLVTYEWNRFFQYGQYIYEKDPEGRPWVDDLKLEGLLLHTRVLYDFFFLNSARNRVTATHFVKNWAKVCHSLWPYLQGNNREHYDRLNSRLAHLDFGRINLSKDWHLAGIFDQGIETWQTFWALVADDKKLWFNKDTGEKPLPVPDSRSAIS